MDDFAILVELHKHNARLGPGSDEASRLALELSALRGRSGLRIADLGCGTGASALFLAEQLDAQIVAVDLFEPFLQELERRAASRTLIGRLSTLQASLDALPFEPGSLDAIWSEGAIYNLGFEKGLASWRPFLAPGGILAASELTWLSSERPAELQAHWDAEYPEVDTAAAKFAVLERQGYVPIGYFPLPEACWLENYYVPLRGRFPALLEHFGHSEAVRACVEAEEHELALYEKYKAFVSYGFYIARKAAD